MNLKQQEYSNLEERWENISYNLVDNYSPIDRFLKDFDNDFIRGIPFISEEFI